MGWIGLLGLHEVRVTLGVHLPLLVGGCCGGTTSRLAARDSWHLGSLGRLSRLAAVQGPCLAAWVHLVSLVWWHPCWIGIRCSPLGGSTLAGGPLWRVRRCLRGPLCSRGICGGSALVAASARSCCCCCHRGGTRAVRVHGPMLPTGGTTPHLGTWRALGGLRPWLCPL